MIGFALAMGWMVSIVCGAKFACFKAREGDMKSATSWTAFTGVVIVAGLLA